MPAHMHVPTMLTMIALASGALALAMAWLSGRNAGGPLFWAAALGVQALGGGLLAAGQAMPVRLPVIAADLMTALANALLLLAVRSAQGRPGATAAVWLPPVALALALPLLAGNLAACLLAANLVALAQALLICRQLLALPEELPDGSRTLILTGLIIALAVAALQIGGALLQLLPGRPAADLGGLMTVAYGAMFVSILLISAGFLRLSVERGDDQLKRTVMKDPLTDCWNRPWVEETAQREIARLKRYGDPTSLILVALDNFEAVAARPTTAGEILKGVAEIAGLSIRATDILGRWDDSQFIVVLPSSGFPQAVQIAERIRSGLESHRFTGGQAVTASLGVAVGLSTDNWGDWLARAERALALARRQGPNLTRSEGLVVDDAAGPQPFRLSWRSGYDSGCDALDAEHRSLFIEANRLLALGGEGSRKKEILAVAESLLADSRAHFATEENLLERHGYPELGQHKAIHRHLLDRFDVMLDRYRQDRVGPAELLHFAAYELIAQHTLIEDRRYHPVLSSPPA